MRVSIFIIIGLIYSVRLHAQESYVFVFLNKKPDARELPESELKRIMEGHLENINRLAKEGKLLVAGPFDGGGGIFILNTTSVEEGGKWLENDPGVQEGRWRLEMFPFTLRTGSLCSVRDSVEMVPYNFIRFIPHVTKYNVKKSPVTLREHDEYIKQLVHTGNLLAEGIFSNLNGSILIVKGDLDQDVIEESPGVKSTLLDFEMKKLWIAKGSFCEE